MCIFEIIHIARQKMQYYKKILTYLFFGYIILYKKNVKRELDGD